MMKNNISQGNIQDEVNKPSHYNSGDIECIAAIQASMSRDEFQGYLKGNCLKYLWRYQYKGKPIQDLEKARWYLNRLLGTFHDGTDTS